MKKWMIISLLVMTILAVTSLSYAWFTYVQRKSLVSFASNTMQVELSLGDQSFESSMSLNGLTYVSLEQEVFQSTTSDGFNEVGLKKTIQLSVPSTSPILKVKINITHLNTSVFYLLIDEGMNPDDETWTSDYHQVLYSLYEVGDTHEIFLEKLGEYNQGVLDQLKTIELRPGETRYLQFIVWVDMDQHVEQIIDPSVTYTIDISFSIISGKGEFLDE